MEESNRLLINVDSPHGDHLQPNEITLPIRHKVDWSQIIRISKRALFSLLPTYIQTLRLSTKRQLHTTAYLDALRGYAALIVFFYHSFPLPNLWLFQKVFFFRVLFHSGPGMVGVFFVISGYVLSYRMLKMMHNRESTRLLDSLASSTFRRWLRLHGSTGVATFIAMTFTWFRWFVPHGTGRKDTFLAQLWNWLSDWLYASNPFAPVNGYIDGWAFRSDYLYQMWTIPVEFRGSIILFVFCAASCKLSIRSRWIFLALVVFLSYYWTAVYVAEFLMGMWIADLSLVLNPERLGKPQLPQTTISEKPNSRQSTPLIYQLGWVVAVVTGMFLLGQPDVPFNPDMPFPWPQLIDLVPSKYGGSAYTFWPSFGAFLLVLGLDNFAVLQTPLKWSFSQYLGDLSFGVYAMHIIVLEGLFKPILNPWREKHLGEGYFGCIVVGGLSMIAVLWLADYFTRADKIVVRLGRWLETKTFQKW